MTVYTPLPGGVSGLVSGTNVPSGNPAINMPAGTQFYGSGGLFIDARLQSSGGYFAAIELVDGYGQTLGLASMGNNAQRPGGWNALGQSGVTAQCIVGSGATFPANVPLTAKGQASQTGDLFQAVDSAWTVLTRINSVGVIFPVQATTGSAPPYVKGGLYFDTTLNKLRVGGATAWETVTSS